MNLDRLLSYVRNPETIAPEATAELEGLVQEFPYFQAAQVLLLKHYKQQNSSRFNRQLRLTAALAPSRVQLFKLVGEWPKEERSAKDEVESLKDEVGSAKDEVGSEKEVVGSAKDEVGNLKDEVGSAKDEVGSEKEVVGSAKEEVGSEKDEEGSEKGEVGSEKDEEGSDVETAAELTTVEPVPFEEQLALAPVLISTDVPKVELAQAPASGPSPAEVAAFIAQPHDRFSWFRFFAGKPLREQSEELLDQLYLAHMQQDLLQAPAQDDELQAIRAKINREEEVPSSASLEQEIRRLAFESISDDELPASETLAGIYVAQHDYKKAIRIYQKLILKFPDKMSYFAALIEELRSKI